jgi:hypothetical protein
VAYRFVARYYDDQRLATILQLLEVIEEASGPWQICVQETLDGAPLPELPPPWA